MKSVKLIGDILKHGREPYIIQCGIKPSALENSFNVTGLLQANCLNSPNPEKRFRTALSAVCDNCKIRNLKACAADESAVNVFHCEEACSILGVAGSAVLDGDDG